MFLIIRLLSIYLLTCNYSKINCDVFKIINNNSDYNNSDYDYDYQNNDKLFGLIEPQELIDALKESEALHKNITFKSSTKDEEELNTKIKEYIENPDKNNVKEVEKTVKELEKKSKNSIAFAFNETILSPFIQSTIDKLEVLSRPLMKKLLPMTLPMTDLIYESDLSPLCMAAMIRLFKGLNDKSFWAIKWVESMARIPSGLTAGSTFDFGEYDQCLESVMPETPTSDLVIKGKYCIGGIGDKNLVDKFSFTGGMPTDSQDKLKDQFFGHKNFRLISREAYLQTISKYSKDAGLRDDLLDFSTVADFTFKGNGIPLAVCIPNVCSSVEINNFINKTIYPKTGIPFGIAGGCETIDDQIVIDTHQIIAISTFSVLFVLVLISSFFDLLTKRKEYYSKLRNSLGIKMLLSFSYQKNLKALAAPPKQIRCIDGIRVITSIWIFIAHSYLFNLIMAFTWKRPKATFLTSFETDDRYLLIRNAYLTETFFFMSSFLFTFIMYPKIVRIKGQLNYIQLFAIRWLRFMPTLVASIFLLYIAPLYGSGPLFKSAYQTMNYPCYKNWLRNILFINNLWMDTVDEMCNGPTWYLSAEFQLFIFSPFIVVLLYKTPKFTTILLVFLTLFGCFTSIIPAIFLDKIPTTSLVKIEDPEQIFIDLYYYLYPPYAHISAYSLGILVGYLMRKHSDYCKSLSRLTVSIIWVVSIFLGVFVFTFNKDWNKPGNSPTYAQVLFLVGAKSICISGFTCGVTFNCANGYGGFLNNFLSWKVWVPLARLSMGVYLYQMPVIFHRVFSVKYTVEMNDYYILTTVAFDCFITFIIAFVLFMIVEGPFGNLTQLLTTNSKIGKTLGLKLNKNISLKTNNVETNRYKLNSDLSNDCNNNDINGRDNPTFVAEDKTKL